MYMYNYYMSNVELYAYLFMLSSGLSLLNSLPPTMTEPRSPLWMLTGDTNTVPSLQENIVHI